MALNMSLEVLLETSSLNDSPWWLYLVEGAEWTIGLAVASFSLALLVGTVIGTLRTSSNRLISGFCEAWIELCSDFHLVLRGTGNHPGLQRLDYFR